MDPELGLCRGCYRTLEEIARWAEMSERERTQVARLLPMRRARSAGDAPPGGAN